MFYRELFRALVFLGVFVGAFVIWELRTIVVYLLFAGGLFFIGTPVRFRLEKIRIKGREIFGPSMASLAAILIVLVATVMVFYLFIPPVAEEAKQLASMDQKEVAEELNRPLERLFETFDLWHQVDMAETKNWVLGRVGDLLDLLSIPAVLSDLVSKVGSVVLGLFCVLFIAFFLIRDHRSIARRLLFSVPQALHEDIRAALDDVTNNISRYIRNVLLQIALVTMLTSLGLWIVGIEHALLIGLFAGLINVIPYIGPWLGAIFALALSTMSAVHSGYSSELGTVYLKIVVVIALVQTIDVFILQPWLYAKAIRSHPLEIFLIVLAAGSLGGVLGMVFAVPIYGTLKLVVKYAWRWGRQHGFIGTSGPDHS